MSDVSSILVSFGAAVDEKTFNESISKLRMLLKNAAHVMSEGNIKGKNNFIETAVQDITQLDKVAKEKLPKIRQLFEKAVTSKDATSEIQKIIGQLQLLRKETLAVNAVELKTSKTLAGKAVSAGSVQSSPYIDAKTKLDDLYEKDLARSKFLRQAYKTTVGKVEPENMAQLKAASTEFKKYFDAEFKFGRATGNQNWSDKTTFNKVFQSISDRTLRFDKDLGFFTTRMADGAKALGVTQETMRKTQQLTVDGLNATKKVLDMDAKTGTTRGKSAMDQLSLFYGKGAAGADIYGGPLLQTMKLMQNPSFQKLGVGGSAADIANAAVQGNISLTSKGLKVNNEEGLKALKITEDLAIKQGLLSREFKGTGYTLQTLNQKYDKFSDEQKKAFSATGANMKDVESFKAGMKAVTNASKQAVKDVSGSFDLSAQAVANFSGITEKKLTSTQKAFQKLYSEGSDKTRSALEAQVKKQGGVDSPQMDPYLKDLDKVEKAIRAKSLAMKEDARATNSYYQTANRAALMEGLLGKQIEFKGNQLVSVKTKMTDAERVMNKYRHETDQFKNALSQLIAKYGTFGEPFGRNLTLLKNFQKQVEESKNKLNSLGRDGDKWARSIDLSSLVSGGPGSTAVTNFTKEVDNIGNVFDRVHGKGGILKRGITDLFEKFKILAGYAISGSIVYGIGNAFKNAVLGVIQYDQALKDLQAITQSTNYETQKMGDEIFRVATTTKFSVLELAEGMKMLGQAGYTASEAIAALEPIAELATATLSDFGTINDLVTTAMGAFDLDDSEVGRVVDVFGAAINKSKLNVDKLRVAMNYVGPIAHDAGISIEEVAAAMGLFANSGLRASTIGTSFRQIIGKLMSPTDEFREAVLAAGYSMDDVNPRATKFSEIISKLAHIVPDAENAFKFFGQRASSAISVLTKNGTKGFEEMTDKMKETGIVSKMAEKQMEGLQVMIKNLSDTTGVASIKMAQAFGFDVMMKGSVSFLKSVLSAVLNLTEGWGGLIATAVQVGTVLTGLALIIKALRTEFMLGGVATTSFGVTLKVLSGGLALFKTTMTATVATIAGVSVPLWGAIAAISALAVGITTVIGLWRPWESALEKEQRLLDDKTKATESASKAHKGLTDSVDKLVEIMRDSNRTLEERKTAYFKLRSAGVELDSSINSTTDSIEDFDRALDNSAEAMNRFVSRLKTTSNQIKNTLARLREQRWSLAEEKEKNAQDVLNTPEGVVDVNAVIPVQLERTPEEIAKAEQDMLDGQAEKANMVQSFEKMVEGYVDSNEEVAKRLHTAMAKRDNQEIDKIWEEVLSGVAKDMGHSKQFLRDKVSTVLLGWKDWERQGQEADKALASAMKETGGVDKNAEGSRKAAMENLKVLGDQYNLFIETQSQEYDKILNNVEMDAEKKSEEVSRIEASIQHSYKNTAKGISDQFKVINDSIQKDLELYKSQKDASLAKLREEVASGHITSEEFENKKQNVAVELANKEYEAYQEAFHVIKSTGLVSAEMQQEMDNIQAKLVAKVRDASADKAEGLKRSGEKASKEKEKELRDSLKRIRDEYKIADEALDTQMQEALLKNAEKNQFNQRTKEEEEFNIKKEFGEKKLKLIMELMAREAQIKSSGLDVSADKTGKIELEKFNQEAATLESEHRQRMAEKAREDKDLERSLDLEYKELLLQDNMDFYAQQSELEEIEHQRKLEDLERKFLDEELTWDQYYAAQEIENLRHSQKMINIDRQTKQMRLDNQMQLVNEMGGIMGELYSISGERIKAFFYAQKAMVVTEMIMNAYKTWSNAMATPNVSPIFNIPMANIMLAMGLAKAGLVAGLTVAQGVKGFAQGGEITGYSPTPTADNVPIMATAGEFMQPVPTVQYYGKGVMEALRTRSIPRDVLSGFGKSSTKSGGSNFAEGGEVDKNASGEGGGKQESLNIVNILDPGMFDQYMSTTAGERAVMNVISRNPAIIKSVARS